MKFIKCFLTILVASNTLAYSIPLIKRDEIDNALNEFDKTSETTEGKINSLDGQNNVDAMKPTGNDQSLDDNISAECKKVIDEVENCFGRLTVESYDKVCDTFNSVQCQNIVNKKIADNQACKGDDVEMYQNAIIVKIIKMNLSCGKTQDGEYCPIAKYGKSRNDDELTDAVINETCKYKTCRETAVQSFTMYKKLNDLYISQTQSNMVKRKSVDNERVESALTILNKEQCIKQESGASSLNIKSSLLLSFGLFFLLYV
ncbi:hypothetical protein PIROE2DRAFT_61857 [Piromyces sp. E2]|nr:hypothetical protein PIROE2DRAFT_61857 [Piromyces sp. E2]|eukprot:OUM62502.1 hypothetical protein PIROE2DRAFT_61857 [Piromyces sp. E2]